MKLISKACQLRVLFVGSTAVGAAMCSMSPAWAQSSGGAPSVQGAPTQGDVPASDAMAHPGPPSASTLSGAVDQAPSTAAAAPGKESNAQPGDIIVTAQRRSQLALRTPLSLTALDSHLLEQKQITSLTDLSIVAPGVRSGEQNGVNRIFIRGVGLTSFASGADSSVAFYMDGIYVGRPTAQLSSFFDIGRIEVLRGPQGALYGRNATGGAVNVIANMPTRETSGYADISFGNYDLHQEEGALSVPLSENGDLRARVAFKAEDHGGYGHDYGADHSVDDAHTQAVRGILQYNPNSDIDIQLIGGYTHEHDNDDYTINYGAYPGYQLLGVTGATVPAQGTFQPGFAIQNSQDAATAIKDGANRRQGYDVTLNGTFSLTDSLSITSISGWRKFDRFNASSSDGTSVGLGISSYTENSNQASQEVVLNYNKHPFQITAGASYYHEHIYNDVLVPFIEFPGVIYNQNGTMDINAYAVYAQGTWSITDKLRLTGAGRYSSERRDTEGTFTFTPTVSIIDQGHRWSAFTPKAGIEYDIAHGTLLYASATKGFKSGTYNIGQVNPAINPETIWAYEAGVKSRLLDNHLDVSAALFYYNYKNLQVNKILGLQTLTTNAASATDLGFEISSTARVAHNLTFDASFTYLDAKFKNFNSVNPLFPDAPPENLNGNMLPGSPKFQASFGGAYTVALQGDKRKLIFAGDVGWQSRTYFTEFNDNVLSQNKFAKLNLSLKYDSGDRWTVTLWGKNVTDKWTAGNKTLGIALWGFPIYGSIDAPATFGGTLGVAF